MKKFIVLFILVIAGLVFGALWWKNGKMPVNAQDQSQKIFVIQTGKGVREVASELKREELIKDPIVFFLYVKLTGRDRQIQAGNYRLSSSMNLPTLVNSLMHGTLDIWVTIPEGKRAEEIAKILKEKMPSYSSFWNKFLIENEGYLFPDTYLIPKDADIDKIVSIMKNTFYQKISESGLDKNKKDFSNIIIVASLVEREAKLAEDRALVASVIYNRLNLGMSLDIDATIQYALGYQSDEATWWKKELSDNDKKVDSSYNTYLNVGLPPAPICNSGISSLLAAAKPAETDYLYYVSDTNGKNHYARTFEEHNLNIKKYLNR
ncbi:MAG: hypothetical protein A2857_02135 [Candidatus Levybacteria bacterium RIFCSPHIGHO2_01_FULL_36_15]|nr:MAG: hypothetical protein A2857_02135 [Candidatus Levybacteria bacterium RIFCSPHIGHO2_01_FULL_36_15]OGH38776.1 MAG: hypothetical protein A2905_04430 [Candidatus Levybacteria bacterium RIFCSPLOWO2_01_FULL_36_10]